MTCSEMKAFSLGFSINRTKAITLFLQIDTKCY